MRWRVTSRFGGRGVKSQVGLIVLALLAGLLVPLIAVIYVAGRDQLPRSCHAGVATSTQTDGALTWSSSSVLWFADGDLNRARRLVDYTPARQSLRVAPTPPGSASPIPSAASSTPIAASPSGSPSPSGSTTPAASPKPSVPPPAFEAAAIQADRRLVVFLVSNPPGGPGMVSLRLISPLDPPGTAAVEAWSGPWLGGTRDRSEVTLLADGHILFLVPHRFDPPEISTRVVGVAEAGGKPHLVESAPERDFIQTSHTAWAETRSYQLAPAEPKLEGRVIAPNGAAAGLLTLDSRTPLVRRTLHQVAVGQAGHSLTRVVCASAEPLAPAALSPDGLNLAVVTGGSTELLDLGDGRSLAPFVRGRLLDWRG